MSLIILGVIAGSLILFHAMGTLLLTKWAAENSLCVAKSVSQQNCKLQMERQLNSYFAFRHVVVRTKILRGIIHTEILGDLVDHTQLHGLYDLGPSEYKRVSP